MKNVFFLSAIILIFTSCNFEEKKITNNYDNIDLYNANNVPSGSIVIDGLKEQYNRIYLGEYPDKINHPIDACYLVTPEADPPYYILNERRQYTVPYGEIGKIINGRIKIVLLSTVKIPEKYLEEGKGFTIKSKETGKWQYYEDPDLVKYICMVLEDVYITNYFDRNGNVVHPNNMDSNGTNLKFYYFASDGNAWLKTHYSLEPRLYSVKKGWAACLFDKIIQDEYALTHLEKLLEEQNWEWQSDRYFRENGM